VAAPCYGREHGRQHGVKMLSLTVGSLARKALRATKLLRTEILRPIQRHQRAPGQPLKCLQAVALAQLLDDLVETRLQGLRADRVQHRANAVVGRYLPYAAQRLAIRGAVALLQPPLMGKEPLAFMKNSENAESLISAMA